MNDAPLYLFAAADELYVKHMAVSLRSAIHATPDREIVVTLALDQDSASVRKCLRKTIESSRVRIEFVRCDGIRPSSARTSGHISLAAYTRLLMPPLLPESAGRAIYLDSDTIVKKNLTLLENTDLKGMAIGAVENPGFTRSESLGLQSNGDYFNSGILLVDLEAWRRLDATNRCIDVIDEYGDRIKQHDQDVLNVVFRDNWCRLSPIWNFQTSFTRDPQYREYQNEAGIVHFTGSGKPWHFMAPDHPFSEDYWKSSRATRYPHPQLLGYPLDDNVKRIVGRFVKKPAYGS